MSNHNTFNSLTAQTSGVISQMPELVTYLVQNRSARLSGPAHRAALSTKTLTRTPLGDIYERIIDNSKLADMFVFIKAPSGSKIPEVFELKHVIFDILQLKDIDSGLYDVCARLPEFNNKIVINITDIYNEKMGVITDMNRFQGYVVRGLLSRLFYLSGKDDRSMWIPMSAIGYSTTAFGMIMSNIIAQDYNLTSAEQTLINTILSYYYLSQNTSDVSAIVAQLMRRRDLADTMTIKNVTDMIREQSQNTMPLPLDVMCTILQNLGIPRLKGVIDRRYIYTRARRLNTDPLVVATAMDYPPMWIFMIISAMSTQKSGLTFAIKNNRTLTKDRDIFIKSILSMDLSKVANQI